MRGFQPSSSPSLILLKIKVVCVKKFVHGKLEAEYKACSVSAPVQYHTHPAMRIERIAMSREMLQPLNLWHVIKEFHQQMYVCKEFVSDTNEQRDGESLTPSILQINVLKAQDMKEIVHKLDDKKLRKNQNWARTT